MVFDIVIPLNEDDVNYKKIMLNINTILWFFLTIC